MTSFAVDLSSLYAYAFVYEGKNYLAFILVLKRRCQPGEAIEISKRDY